MKRNILKWSMCTSLLRVLLIVTAVAGCATNPYTHRHQLELVPASQERAMGLQAYTKVLSDPKVQISHDPLEVEPVERVAARIIEAAKVSMYAETAKQFECRKHESEADYIGLLLAADAGYDPHEALHVWERMEQMSQGQPPEFLATHPSHGTRITQIEQWMPEAMSHYHPQSGTTAADLPHLSPSH